MDSENRMNDPLIRAIAAPPFRTSLAVFVLPSSPNSMTEPIMSPYVTMADPRDMRFAGSILSSLPRSMYFIIIVEASSDNVNPSMERLITPRFLAADPMLTLISRMPIRLNRNIEPLMTNADTAAPAIAGTASIRFNAIAALNFNMDSDMTRRLTALVIICLVVFALPRGLNMNNASLMSIPESAVPIIAIGARMDVRAIFALNFRIDFDMSSRFFAAICDSASDLAFSSGLIAVRSDLMTFPESFVPITANGAVSVVFAMFLTTSAMLLDIPSRCLIDAFFFCMLDSVRSPEYSSRTSSSPPITDFAFIFIIFALTNPILSISLAASASAFARSPAPLPPLTSGAFISDFSSLSPNSFSFMPPILSFAFSFILSCRLSHTLSAIFSTCPVIISSCCDTVMIDDDMFPKPDDIDPLTAPIIPTAAPEPADA